VKTIFWGTPAVAVPFLELLAQKTQVVGVFTSPDRPAGRGYELASSAVKKAALQRHLPLFQPENLKDEKCRSLLEGLGPVDLAVAVAYGHILPRPLFAYPTHGTLNVHFSLLPKYRGAAPVQWALIRGDKETGVSLFSLDEGMDTGPLLRQAAEPVRPDDDVLSLRTRLIGRGVSLLDEVLAEGEKAFSALRPQSGPPTSAPQLKKEDGLIDWDRPATVIADQVRGMAEWPHAFTRSGDRSLKVLRAEVSSGPGDPSSTAGQVLGLAGELGILVQCRQSVLSVLSVQPEGRKPMDARSFWNGARLKKGDRFH